MSSAPAPSERVSAGLRRPGLRPDAAAAALAALGFAARAVAARGAVVSPDETLHIAAASEPGVAAVYGASLETAHPPLFMLLLHFWKGVSPDPLFLRLLPAACGAFAVWAVYRWVSSLFGKEAGLATAALLAFLPSLVLLTAEIRAYGLLLLLMTASMAVFERSVPSESVPRLLAAMGLAGLSLLTHYGSAWFLLALIGYGSARIRARRSGGRFASAWLGAVAAMGLLALILYVSHISRIRGDRMEMSAQTDWLRASYFQPGVESAWRFLSRQTASVFQFVFSTRVAGAAGLVLFGAALALLVARREPAAILLAAPFVFNAAAGLLDLFPYGGTRHATHLFPFVCAGAGVALARLLAGRAWVVLAAALLPAAFAVGW